MLEARQIVIPGGVTTFFGPLPPSKSGAAVCRVRHGQNFFDDLLFSATFLDAVCRLNGEEGGTFNFLVGRCQALAVAAQLFAARNAFLHDPAQTLVETANIDGLSAQIHRLPHDWYRIGLFADVEPIIEGLEIFGAEALSDFCSGFLPYFAEAHHHQRIRREIREKYGDEAFGGSTPTNTAIHEAAHAVIGMLYGLSVDCVAIEPPAWGGCCDFGPEISAIDLLADARISLAGMVAEEELAGGAKIGECIGDIADAAAAIHHVATQTGADYGALLLQTYAETTDLVLAHRAAIERIADALKERLSLNATDIACLMGN
jgi:hypothetical protein